MKQSILNIFKILGCLILILQFSACGTEVETQEIVDDSSETSIATEVEMVESSTMEKDAPNTGTLQFEPSTEDQKKYTLVKQILQNNRATFLTMVQSGRLSKYRSIMGFSPQKMMKSSEVILTQDLKTFLTRRSMDKSAYGLEMNTFGSVLGFSLIENFGNSKDQGKFLEMSTQVKQLMSSGVVTNVEELRSKMFQAELNSKMTPAPGNENMKIEVGEDGKVYIKQ